jgi:C_GCAxxG_C_C family probable redox protein
LGKNSNNANSIISTSLLNGTFDSRQHIKAILAHRHAPFTSDAFFHSSVGVQCAVVAPEDFGMATIDQVKREALGQFHAGHNCAQSVLLAMARNWKIENELVPKIATAFGGGIGRYGSVCGALTGGAMSIGLRYGTNEPSAQKRLDAYDRARKLCQQFQMKHGSILCRELIGYDLSKPEELEKARQAKVLEEKCEKYVQSVIEMLLKADAH